MNWRQIEKEYQEIDDAYERGEMTIDEARKARKELDREVRDLQREELARRGGW